MHTTQKTPEATAGKVGSTPYAINPPPWIVAGNAPRVEIHSTGAEFSPSFVAENLLPEDAKRAVRAVNAEFQLVSACRAALMYCTDDERYSETKTLRATLEAALEAAKGGVL